MEVTQAPTTKLPTPSLKRNLVSQIWFQNRPTGQENDFKHHTRLNRLNMSLSVTAGNHQFVQGGPRRSTMLPPLGAGGVRVQSPRTLPTPASLNFGTWSWSVGYIGSPAYIIDTARGGQCFCLSTMPLTKKHQPTFVNITIVKFSVPSRQF